MDFYSSIAKKGNSILIRGYRDGKRYSEKSSFEPTFFFPSALESKYKTIDGKYVTPQKFPSMWEAKKAMDDYKDIENLSIFGSDNFIHQAINEKFPKKIEFDLSLLRVHYLDIEVIGKEAHHVGFPTPDKAEFPIVAITIFDSKDQIYHVWSDVEWTPSKSILDASLKISHRCFLTEDALLKDFVQFWSNPFTCPDSLTGWNIRSFDIPYIYNRLARVLGEEFAKKISPWKQVNERIISVNKKQIQTFEIVGIEQFDYLDLFQKFALKYGNQESYKLDHIAEVVLGENKVDLEEYGNLRTLYEKNPQLFIDYNIKDVVLVARMNDKLGLIELAYTMMYRAGCSGNEVFGTTSIWDAMIHRTLMDQSIVVPPRTSHVKQSYAGAYVKDSIIGSHDWVCSFDVSSLYPSIIVQWNMSPETILTGKRQASINIENLLNDQGSCEHPKATAALNGQLFAIDHQGFIPKIIEEMFNERQAMKKQMLAVKKTLETIPKDDRVAREPLEKELAHYSNNEYAIKNFLNSYYGAMGNIYFRYYRLEIAEGITLTGQFIIQYVEKKVNEYLNRILKTQNLDYCILSDTDSIAIRLNGLVDMFVKDKDIQKKIDFLDKVCEKIQADVIDKAFESIFRMTNGISPFLKMKREFISNRGIVVAKKRYLMQIYDNEGVRFKEPQLKIMGVEAIKASTPKVCRNAMKEVFHIMLNDSEAATQKYIENFKKRFMTLPIEDIAIPKSVSSVKKYMDKNSLYVKRTPINSRAAILYNHLLLKHNLLNTYEKIADGDKIKYVYMNPRNPLKEDVMGFTLKFPKEFGMEQYVDRETQYEKTFVRPMELVLTAIGWTPEECNNLDSFFS